MNNNGVNVIDIKNKNIQYIPVNGKSNNSKSIPRQKNAGTRLYNGSRKAKKAKLIKKIKTYALLTVTIAGIAFVIKDELSKEDITISMSQTDTLSGIANDFDVPLEDIVRNNGIINADNVSLGEEINLTTRSENVDEFRDKYDIIYEERQGKTR